MLVHSSKDFLTCFGASHEAYRRFCNKRKRFLSILRKWRSETVKIQCQMPKKSFFPALTRVGFWLVAHVLCVCYARYAYKKCLLESRETFGITWRIIRHVQMIIWQEKVIFVDFRKWYSAETWIYFYHICKLRPKKSCERCFGSEKKFFEALNQKSASYKL